MEAFETFEHAGFTVELHQDYDAENPYKAWDQASELLIGSRLARDYDLGETIDLGRFTSCAHAARYLTLFGGYALAIPFRFDDYGSNGARTYLVDESDSCSGFLVLTREAYDREFGAYGMPLHATLPDEHSAERTIRAEFDSFAAWVGGEVAGFVVKNPGGGFVDSCFGYYGEIEYVRGEGRSSAEHHSEEYWKARALPWLPTFGKPIQTCPV